MTQFDTHSSSTMIFTLEDDPVETPTQPIETPSDNLIDLPNEIQNNEETETDWERSLKELRNRKQQESEETFEDNLSNISDITIAPATIPAVTEPLITSTEYAKPEPQIQPEPMSFGDHELDAAYREFLRQAEAEHNASESIVEEEIDVLIQEDWLNAQSALQSEYMRKNATLNETIIMENVEHESDLVSGSLKTGSTTLPSYAIHVYALPDLPSTRRVRVISEQELMQGIRDKLKPHLSNAVAGMVRQALQRKMAMLSYDLQTMLNEETPHVVQDVLDHNLDAIFRSVKNSLREQKK
ncbi:hypothetical protein MIS46_05690 [Wielerella bovis]|uniref:hypothetical protein n=1 Tax=Wielerella bovis TaxID=2917790 RepID=UPI00201A11D5|nr:hypothetical protein [Wielerella bovis]ULJ63532.1 hypothetical protein MIS46_05690 [Wielerella bovis]